MSDSKVIPKARKYCAYQERSQQELRDKLYSWGLHRKEVEEVIVKMIEEGFINEERFAIAFAGGKFRMKRWGKIKIKQALKKKKVSDYCLRKALSQIDSSDYSKALEKVLKDYSKKISEKNPLRKKYRLAQHAISKGYEPEMVWEMLRWED